MHLSSLALALSVLASAYAAPASHTLDKRAVPVAKGFSWNDRGYKIRGLNIGGWLVLEPWITPSIFDAANKSPGRFQAIVDEYTLCSYHNQGGKFPERCRQNVLQQHWDSWVGLSDFEKIKGYGFNLVRIPIGFWAYDNRDTPYSRGAAAMMDKAIGWARQVGLMVMIDLHGAPGSQNGFDNSGRLRDKPYWQSSDPGAVRTLHVLDKIQKKYGGPNYDDVIAGIELLNEPLTAELDFDKVKQFTRNGYMQQRRYGQNRVVVFQDGFKSPSSYNNFLTPSDQNSQNVAVDHHDYQVFDMNTIKLDRGQHVQAVCNGVQNYAGADKWTVVGEWSGAMTDCASYLNGYGKGARYDGSFPGSSYVGSCSSINNIDTWSADTKRDYRKFIEAQLDMYEMYSKGWVFWNFKTEGSAAEWDAFRLLKAGVFPSPLTARKYGSQCKL